MRSEPLRYRPVEPDDLDAFHRLDLFSRRGVGVWLAHAAGTGELVGFCGFWSSPDSPEPMLVYALLESWSGRGLATEMGRTVIERARVAGGFTAITADADAVNARSVRVLEKLGFERIGARPGAFGDILLFRLPAGAAARSDPARPG
jgi:RimJ/RimL family protein N-acetyltransferase